MLCDKLDPDKNKFAILYCNTLNWQENKEQC